MSIYTISDLHLSFGTNKPMNIFKELTALFSELGILMETMNFTTESPDDYVVITPLVDTSKLYADNNPIYENQEVRISLFTKSNYLQLKYKIVHNLFKQDFYITDKRYIGFETDTGYHHYAIDVAKQDRLHQSYDLLIIPRNLHKFESLDVLA